MMNSSLLCWPRGNDVSLTVYLYEPQVDEHGIPVRDQHGNIVWEPVDIDAYDEWRVRVKTDEYILLSAAAGATAGTLVVKVPGTFPCGVYAVEFTGMKNGFAVRSFETTMFGIVESNGDANVTFDVVEGERSCDVDIKIQIVPQTVTRGKNAYELWKEQPGNEDKTLQDYLDSLQPVQSDWDEADDSAMSFIKNKPPLKVARYADMDETFDSGLYIIGGTYDLLAVFHAGAGVVFQARIITLSGELKYRLYGNGAWSAWTSKYQDVLISGTNIKTINDQSILGSGNIEIEGGGGDSSLVHWTFTQEGTFESPTWDTDGHKYSDITALLNEGKSLLVTLNDLDGFNSLYIYDKVIRSLFPLEEGSTAFYIVSEGANDSISLTLVHKESSLTDTVGTSLEPFERSVKLYGDDTISGSIANVAKVEVDDMGVTITTTNGKKATYNDNEIYAKPSAGIPKTDLASAVQTSLGKADTALQAETDPTVQAWAKTGIRLGNTVLTPETLGFLSSLFDLDVSQGNLTIRLKTGDATPVIVTGIISSNDDGGWEHAGNGAIPTVGLVYTKVNSKYTKPSTGIPKTDLAQAVQTSLGKADSAYQKPSSGIPASDLASDVIPDVSNFAEKTLVVDASTLPSSLDPNKVYEMGTLTGSVTIPAFSAVPAGDTEAKIWCFTFDTSTTAPTITWPAAITNWVGGSAPTINASKNYEVTVMDGIGAIMEA